MTNLLLNDLNPLDDPEITAHMLPSTQLMIKIQQEAEKEFNAIAADIKAGRTTLEAVKAARGLAV